MNEQQVLPALLGSLGTALVTAVSGLAWMVRRQHSNGRSPNGLGSLMSTLNTTLTKQTELLTTLVKTAELHNTETSLRQEVLVRAMDTLQRFNERG